MWLSNELDEMVSGVNEPVAAKVHPAIDMLAVPGLQLQQWHGSPATWRRLCNVAEEADCRRSNDAIVVFGAATLPLKQSEQSSDGKLPTSAEEWKNCEKL